MPLGYIAIYLIVYGSSFSKNHQLLAPFFLAAYFICDIFLAAASRRLCNCTFVFWTIFFLFYHYGLSGMIRSYLSIPSSEHKKKGNTPQLAVTCQFGDVFVDSINRHPLVTFLFANLLTGCVNLITQSLFLGPLTSLVLIFLYGCMVSIIGYFFNVKLYAQINKNP